MASGHSSERSRADKPRKPYPDFPLGWHPAGYGANGFAAACTISVIAADWQEKRPCFTTKRCATTFTLAESLVRNPIRMAPRSSTPSIILTDKERAVESGELTERSFNEYVRSCKRFGKEFGNERLLIDLRPEDFSAYRARACQELGPTTLTGEILRLRVALKHAYDAGLIESPIRYGNQFKLPTKKTLRIHRNEKGERLFTASELRQLINAADFQLKAMICWESIAASATVTAARLELKHLDLAKRWVSLPRSKTGIRRHAQLWQETIDAIRVAVEKRYEPRDENTPARVRDKVQTALVFRTRQ